MAEPRNTNMKADVVGPMARAKIAAAPVAALTTAYGTAIAITGGGGLRAIPEGGAHLFQLVLALDTIVTATAITVLITMDAAGDLPVTDEVTPAIVVSPSGGGKGSVNVVMDFPYRRFPGVGVAGTIYLFAKTDAGTCNATSRILFAGSE